MRRIRPFLWGVFSLVAASVLRDPARASCSFVYQFDEGSLTMSNPKLQALTLVGSPFTGRSMNNRFINVLGYLPTSSANYTNCFLVTGRPLAVQITPGSRSGSLLVNAPDQKMTLAWTDGTNGVPVEYNVYLGADPTNLPLAGTVSQNTFPAQNLAFGKNYYWKIDSVDIYGRDTWSLGTFSFSLAPSLSHLYCAPNPFRAGTQFTTFIFNSPGPGSARMKIFSLPHADLVFDQPLDSLTDGTNLWTYNGLDGRGQPLYNGVYMAVLELQGSQRNELQRFKFLVIK